MYLTINLPEGRYRTWSSVPRKKSRCRAVSCRRRGYNGFSYADISNAIGIRKASVHHHFPTKAALVAVLVERYVGRAKDGLNSLRNNVADPANQLEAYLDYWQKCVLDARSLLCLRNVGKRDADAPGRGRRAGSASLSEPDGVLASVLRDGKSKARFD